jgi:hypothetical protein
MRVGLGVDVHAFAAPEEGRRLVLGGVEIPSDRGLLGHSDADVLAHAIADALLGAAGLEDIGHYFPVTDERYRDTDSIELLREVRGFVGESWRLPTWTPSSSASGQGSRTTERPCGRTWPPPSEQKSPVSVYAAPRPSVSAFQAGARA